ncbi:dimethylarginine dimethylaminohydrolase [Lentibacter algarum]|uniref:dimethylarginine dimethylaminohydrolase family protein n=1 Tax=Lentibacter algarum TaxID=576131 RepID=UPI001C06DDFA|nr:arginine deiminase family protein [Lentibacter algarum]MBU2981017.1 dimethylarginine dimethylaminohydrolase [Lentibacter algarum]
MSARSYTFTHAISRRPSKSIIDGLRAIDIGTPDLALFEAHHADYVAALRSTGAKVELLEADEAYPDSVFIEDAALCLPKGAVVMRPGAPSRLGEAAVLAPTLASYYSDIRTIDAPDFIEGGDILTTEREILVGTSARTTTGGIEALRRATADWGYTVREVHTPEGVLHFKTDCSLLDEETILSTERLSVSGCFEGYKVLHTAEGEEACANAIRFNELVIMPAGFPKTAEMLDKAGYNLRLVGNTEAAKLDGGMSCLSLRFSPPVA